MDIDPLTEARFAARLAEEDTARWRETLMPQLYPSGDRPSDDTAIAFAVQAIRHSRRISPENPLGTLGRVDVASDHVVAVVRSVMADLQEMGTRDCDRLALTLGDLLVDGRSRG